MLTLLDLSAACNTIDHKTLVHHLEVSYGVSDTVHRWFVSYLSRRSQSVGCGSTSSLPKAVLFGVPGPARVGLGTDPLPAVYSRPDRSS